MRLTVKFFRFTGLFLIGLIFISNNLKAQTILFSEDFNSGYSSWAITSSGNATQTWDSTSSHYGFDFDGTPYMICYDWSGMTTSEILTSPSFSTSSASSSVYLQYDFNFLYQSTTLEGHVDVYDGST